MRIAHALEAHGPAGAPWRLVGSGLNGTTQVDGRPWLDLEVVRRRLLARDPGRAHNSVLFRQPITTLDDHLGRGLRIEALAELVDAFAALGPLDQEDDAV